MNNIETKKIKEIGELIKGICILVKNKDIEDNSKKIKVLGISNIKTIYSTGKIEGKEVYKVILNKKYKKEDCYVQKNDIVISICPRINSENIYYIEEKLLEECIYNDSVFILRCDEKIVNSKYIYEILKSDFYTRKLTELSERASGTLKRLTIQALLDVEIPILSKKKQEQLLEEIKQAKMIMQKVNSKIEGIAQTIENKKK